MIRVNYQGRLLERSTDFFAQTPFKDKLSEELRNLKMMPKDISEVSIKCLSYGYFPEFRDIIKENLLKFVKDCLNILPNLISFKLIFNGFEIGKKYLHKIIEMIKTALGDPNSKIVSLLLHTNHLTNCLQADFLEVLDLITVAGMAHHREEISIQITHWEFNQKITLSDLEDDFRTFLSNSIAGLNFKKFRLEMSSWYLQPDQAFEFVRDGMTDDQIIEKMEIQNRETLKLVKDYLKDKRNQKYKQFIDETTAQEKRIKKTLGRTLHQEIIFHLIKDFHKKLVEMVQTLLNILSQVEDFTLDLRNWNDLLKMHELRSVLQTKSGAKKEFSMIQRKSSFQKGQSQDLNPVLRTTFLV